MNVAHGSLEHGALDLAGQVVQELERANRRRDARPGPWRRAGPVDPMAVLVVPAGLEEPERLFDLPPGSLIVVHTHETSSLAGIRSTLAMAARRKVAVALDLTGRLDGIDDLPLPTIAGRIHEDGQLELS